MLADTRLFRRENFDAVNIGVTKQNAEIDCAKAEQTSSAFRSNPTICWTRTMLEPAQKHLLPQSFRAARSGRDGLWSWQCRELYVTGDLVIHNGWAARA